MDKGNVNIVGIPHIFNVNIRPVTGLTLVCVSFSPLFMLYIHKNHITYDKIMEEVLYKRLLTRICRSSQGPLSHKLFIRFERWEFIKEKKKVRKNKRTRFRPRKRSRKKEKENTLSTKQSIKKKIKTFFFLDRFFCRFFLG